MIAYLSTQTARVFKNFKDAHEDAKLYIALKMNVESYEKAKKLAEIKIFNNPNKYIKTVIVYI